MSCCNSGLCNAQTLKPQILAVILDLDGTLLDTERATKDVFKEFLAKYGKVLDMEREEKKADGMTLKDSSAAIVKDYDLPLTPDQYIQEIIPMHQEKWMYVRALPGATRLIKHLYNHGIPLALASNSLREYIDKKISHQKGWKECFTVILGSDQVKAGKPSPDLFEEAAKRMGVDPSQCIVIEDSLVGVKAANAAKMEVVAVPPRSETDFSSLANIVLHSLLEFEPDLWGLPPFEDWVDNALPIEPIYLSGQYVNGFLHDVTEDGTHSLPNQVFGVFFGCAYAEVDKQRISKVLVWIGNERCSRTHQKKIQMHLVDETDVVSYASNQQMTLELFGYIRFLTGKESGCFDTKLLEEYKSIARASMDLPKFTQNSHLLSE
ncbi:bifunctional riboflavin kinase/FMN phosphatase-like [Humulus lupulus]|uniref:bifunctional riboflavin kinase/FMN phosphatase-like n=1 Tax=Humulus lupulus TaxID=3486 RepID=UPI002B407EF2|nr:bifunctional riboflavin kinase/FMN phosphatase-like [Humulus lupulus]